MEGSIVPKRKYYHSKKKVLSFWKESNIGLRNVNYFHGFYNQRLGTKV